MTIDLSGRVCVVTGGNRGIGLGLAHALADAGADLAIWGRDAARNEQAVAEIEAAHPGRRVTGIGCDVGDEAQVIAATERTIAVLGKLDSMVANAGIGGFAPFTKMSLEEWRRVQRVNLDGVFLCFREAARHLVERGEGGALVAISSVSAIDGAPGMEHYASAKAGVLALVRGVAVELARHRIRANSILPGWTESEMLDPETASPKFVEATVKRTPVRRWGTPADLGPACVYLADPANSFHTGDALVVDGGYSIF